MKTSNYLSLIILISLFSFSCNNEDLDDLKELEDCGLSILITENSCSKFSITSDAEASIQWEVDGDAAATSEKFEYNPTSAGTFEICGNYKTPLCPNGNQVCKTINVSEECFFVSDCSVSLTKTETSCSSFTLSNSHDLEMEWKVNSTPTTVNKTFEFTPKRAGTFEVCGSYKTSACPEGTQVCTTLEVEEDCFFVESCEVELTKTENSCASYLFSNSEKIMMDWTVNDAKISTSIDCDFNAVLPGIYEICGFYKTTECPQGQQVCASVEIAQLCLTPNMCESQLLMSESSCSKYVLYPDHELMMDWTVNGNPMQTSGLFTFEANEPGTYEICGINTTSECSDEIRACKTLIIEQTCFVNEACQAEIVLEEITCSKYKVSNSLDVSMDWILSGFQVAEGKSFNFEALIPGTYEICGQFDSSDCPEGATVCKTIEVAEDCFL